MPGFKQFYKHDFTTKRHMNTCVIKEYCAPVVSKLTLSGNHFCFLQDFYDPHKLNNGIYITSVLHFALSGNPHLTYSWLIKDLGSTISVTAEHT